METALNRSATPGPAAANPAPAGRTPGPAQSFVLLVTSGLSVLVVAVLGPSLPAMQEHFKGVPGADVLVPMTLGAPMLVMALLSIGVGELADRWGRKRLLVAATAMYALIGTMPLYLESLHAVIASRLALGAVEAVLMTISTAMIGDYYEGVQRDRAMALQTTVASIAAVVLSFVGGALGAYGWRAPYALFAVSLLLAPAMAWVLWEPVTRANMSAAQRFADSQSFKPKQLMLICGLALILGLEFLIVPAHLGYLLAAVGVTGAPQIGLAYGINSLGSIVGTLLYGWGIASALSLPVRLGIGAVISGAALAAMQFSGGLVSLTAAGFTCGLGMGILFPALVTWNMRELPVSKRGFGTGAFQSSLFLGMFISPVLVVALERVVGGPRTLAVGMEGWVLVALGVVSLAVGAVRKRA